MEIIKRGKSMWNDRYKVECTTCGSILILELKEFGADCCGYKFLCPVCGRTKYVAECEMEKIDS